MKGAVFNIIAYNHALQDYGFTEEKTWKMQWKSRYAPFLLGCEQPLFFFGFSKGSPRARESWEARAAAREEKKLPHLAPSVTRVVICVSRAFCSTDQEKRETARSLHVCLLQGGYSNSGFSADHVTVTCPGALPVFAHWVIRWAAVSRHRWRGWAADFVLLPAASVVLAAVCVRERATQLLIKRLSLECQCTCRKTSRVV